MNNQNTNEILKNIARGRPNILHGIVLLIAFVGIYLWIKIEGKDVTLTTAKSKKLPHSSSLKEAQFYKKIPNQQGEVLCELCPRNCIIPDGVRGFCRVRENRKGKLYTLVYNKPCAMNVSPIEKAPLYHFYPGHTRLTLATVSCNLRCKHCQNWHISQIGPGEGVEYNLSPQEVVKEALKQGVRSISFTYTEPTIFYEYMYDICRLAKKKGLLTSIVSNGYINPEPLKKLLPYLDAVKIDLKAFTEKFYRETCLAELEPVLTTLKVLKEEGAFFEIVNLVIPTLNDNPKDIERMCKWIKNNLGDEVPIHFTRFHPAYKVTHLPPTPIETLEKAIEIAQKVGLKYVYIGNVPGHKYNNTFCPKCKKRIVHRVHFSVLSNNIVEGKCKFCKYKIKGIW